MEYGPYSLLFLRRNSSQVKLTNAWYLGPNCYYDHTIDHSGACFVLLGKFHAGRTILLPLLVILCYVSMKANRN